MGRLWTGSQVVVVYTNGALGGLAIVCNPWEIIMINIVATYHTLSSLFHLLGTNIQGSLIHIYGSSIPTLKNRMINYLEGFVSQNPVIFTIIGGEFNMIIYVQENKGAGGY